MKTLVHCNFKCFRFFFNITHTHIFRYTIDISFTRIFEHSQQHVFIPFTAVSSVSTAQWNIQFISQCNNVLQFPSKVKIFIMFFHLNSLILWLSWYIIIWQHLAIEISLESKFACLNVNSQPANTVFPRALTAYRQLFNFFWKFESFYTMQMEPMWDSEKCFKKTACMNWNAKQNSVWLLELSKLLELR